MTTKYYVDGTGLYLGGFAGVEPPEGAIEVDSPPDDARQRRVGNSWGALPVTSDLVDAERDRRIALGFNWQGKTYQSRQFDLDNIRSMGAAAAAMLAQGQGDVGYRWFDPGQDFVWIAADNTLTPMTAADMIDFAMTAAKWVKDCIFAASVIKGTPGGIPADYATDSRWPIAA